MFSSSTLFSLATLALTVTAAPLQRRAQFHGRGTFYDVGEGNCGGWSTSNQYVVALNTAQYGSTSQVSGYCGQTVTITYNGNTEQATVVDSCPTCPNQALDMSTSLFSALTNGNMDLGEIYMSWSFGSGSSSSSNQKSSNNDDDSTATTTTASSTSTAATTTTTQAIVTSTPTNTATKLVSGVPQWWKVIGNDACPNVTLPAGVDPVSVAPSGNAEVDTLPAACGKWVQIFNYAMNKSTKAMLTNYNLGGPRGTIYLGDAYLKISNMTGSFPTVIQNATWGFLN